jgi:hypothetical protein
MQIELIDFLILPVIFLIGAITSWEDFYTGRVRNKWLKLGFLYGLGVLVFLSLKGLLLPHLGHSIGLDIKIPYIYFLKVYNNTCIAAIIAFFLWKKGLLAAGDAKLFILFTFLLPLKYYWKSYLPYFPSFALLTNIIVPIFISFFYYAVHDWLVNNFNIIKDYKNIDFAKIKEDFSSWFVVYLKNLVGFSATFLLVAFFSNNFFSVNPENSGYVFLFSVFVRKQIQDFFSAKKWLSWLFLAALGAFAINILRIGFVDAASWALNTLRMVVIFNTLFLVINIIIENYISSSRIKMKIKNLRPGIMVILNKMPLPKIGKIMGGGISKEQVEILKKWGKANNYKEIETYKNIPFAVWIFVGTLVTIIFQKSVIIMFFEII